MIVPILLTFVITLLACVAAAQKMALDRAHAEIRRLRRECEDKNGQLGDWQRYNIDDMCYRQYHKGYEDGKNAKEARYERIYGNLHVKGARHEQR